MGAKQQALKYCDTVEKTMITAHVMDGDRLMVTGKSDYFLITFAFVLLREQRIGEEIMEAILFVFAFFKRFYLFDRERVPKQG